MRQSRTLTGADQVSGRGDRRFVACVNATNAKTTWTVTDPKDHDAVSLRLQ